jgi:hypothetical protein
MCEIRVTGQVEWRDTGDELIERGPVTWLGARDIGNLADGQTGWALEKSWLGYVIHPHHSSQGCALFDLRASVSDLDSRHGIWRGQRELMLGKALFGTIGKTVVFPRNFQESVL